MRWTRLFIQRIKITNTKTPSAEAERPSKVVTTQCLDSETATPGLHPYASLDVTEGQCPKCSPFSLKMSMFTQSLHLSLAAWAQSRSDEMPEVDNLPRTASMKESPANLQESSPQETLARFVQMQGADTNIQSFARLSRLHLWTCHTRKERKQENKKDWASSWIKITFKCKCPLAPSGFPQKEDRQYFEISHNHQPM